MKITIRTFDDDFSELVSFDVDSKAIKVAGLPKQRAHAVAFLALNIVKLSPATIDVVPVDFAASGVKKNPKNQLSISITDRRGHEIFAVEPAFSTGCETPAKRDRIIAALAQTLGAMAAPEVSGL